LRKYTWRVTPHSRFFTLNLLLPCLAVAQTPASPPAETLKWGPGLYAKINTSVGVITALLFEKETPLSVQTFIGLARGTHPWLDPKTHKLVARPLYRDLIFHRVIPDFMIQTGDPTATGSHNCGFVVPDEFVPELKFDRAGRLALANGGPKTAACQFFITEDPYPAGNGKYTIFGQVVEGQELVSKISHVIRDEQDKPRLPAKLIDITFVRIVEPAAPEAH
jgi:peptidyl-prolyl cis-trans isomerase A (cyclophilin A)